MKANGFILIQFYLKIIRLWSAKDEDLISRCLPKYLEPKMIYSNRLLKTLESLIEVLYVTKDKKIYFSKRIYTFFNGWILLIFLKRKCYVPCFT